MISLLKVIEEVPAKPYRQPAEVPLDGSAALWCTDSSPCSPVIQKLTAVAFHPVVQGVNEDIKPELP